MSDPAMSGLPSGLDPRVRVRRAARASGPSRRRRIFRRVLFGGGVLVAVAAVGLYGLYQHYNGQITRVGIRLAVPPARTSSLSAAGPAKAADGSQNSLLMGSDSRDFAGGNTYNVTPGSPAYVTGQRSDVVMLLHIPAGGAKATVVSFPRDSWVHIPAYVDAKGVTRPAVWAKLNAAFALGGAPLLVATIEELTGLHVDHFASVNFPGFEGMVDALGGLNVCIGTSRHDKNSGDFLTVGQHHIAGAQALALVRDRESFPNQDLGRIKDQEYFLSVMMHKVLSSGTLTNPLKLNQFLNVATKSLTVDTGLSLGDMRKLAARFAHLGSADLTFETAPVSNPNYQVTSSVYGGQIQSAVELDPASDAQLFAGLGGEQPTASGTSSSATSSAAAVSVPQVRVRVDNATTTSGLAHRVAAELSAFGFGVVGTGNAPAGTPPDTVIRYRPGDVAAAQTLQSYLPSAHLQLDNTIGDSVVLVIGNDYQHAHPPATSISVSGRPSATAVVTTSPMTAANLSCAP